MKGNKIEELFLFKMIKRFTAAVVLINYAWHFYTKTGSVKRGIIIEKSSLCKMISCFPANTSK